jgi:hypothetical protein
MKRIVILLLFNVIPAIILWGQESVKMGNPSYMYNSNPGYVNITEINGGVGLGDTAVVNTKSYFGVTNVFGYQISRNFVTGVGIGYYRYETLQHIPLFLEYRYSSYLKKITPFFSAVGGLLLDPSDLKNGTKLFINPGIGFSRAISSRFEAAFSAGLNLQMGDNMPRMSFISFKLGIVYRKNSFRLFKPS